MTVKELREEAQRLGVDLTGIRKKADIEAAIAAHGEAPEEAPAEAPTDPPPAAPAPAAAAAPGVFGFTQSGAELLASMVAQYLYPDTDYSGMVPDTTTHWSRSPKGAVANLGAKLLGAESREKKLYVYRDGRDVMRDLYDNTDARADEELDFSFRLFLRKNLNWRNNPSTSVSPRRGKSLLWHWREQLDSWKAKEGDDVLLVRYEELVLDPQRTLSTIASWLGVPAPRRVELPGELGVAQWVEAWGPSNKALFKNSVVRRYWGCFSYGEHTD